MAALPPLREPTFLILTALALQPMHGYGIVRDVTALSGGRVALRPGTLYGALDRLGDEGLVEPDHEEVVDGRLRRYYRLTDTGRATLSAETERLRRNVEAASQRLRSHSEETTPATGSPRGAARRPVSSPVLRPTGGPA
ncbi:PadR family transcriptional regulator [Micromonospora sp. NPDC049366]|uniref:PadR family transcriptional regulator n=1 Tax=Micromonospora sp. NPDC049366 TaxID=3364271 RepID=UPI00379D6A6E